jgi:predicted AlkP superfamily phosphohydrolase/phosphomutase
MNFIKNFLGRNKKKRMMVLSLGGVPYSYIKKLSDSLQMPVFNSLVDEGEFKEIKSVIPTTIAWPSFITGLDPSDHNIFGFIDRRANPFELFISELVNMKAPAIWDELSKMGFKSIVMNIPMTYPPEVINGIMISGFPCTQLEKAIYPEELEHELLHMGYIIDADTWIVRRSKERFIQELNKVLEKRFRTIFKFIEEKEWNYFQCHIMETDQLNLYYWGDMEDKHPQFKDDYLQFYKRIDAFLGQLLVRISRDSELIILSDSGFCRIKKEVQLNYWLEKESYLKYRVDDPESLEDMSPDSKVYSLLPGRIFINRKGREEYGSVDAGEYFSLRDELKDELLQLKDEESGEAIIEKVYFREEIYSGPYLEQAADLIAIPYKGYDLRSDVKADSFLSRGFIQGMHTYDDAFIYMRNLKLENGIEKLIDVESIQDVKGIILSYFNN